MHAIPDEELSLEQKSHEGYAELRVPRGEIVDRSGSLLAKDRQALSLWADPRTVPDAEKVATVLSAQLGVSEQDLRQRLAKDESPDANKSVKKFVWIKRWLTDQDIQIFKDLDPKLKVGLALKTESSRYYPEGELAAHVLGFVNQEGLGCSGVEKSFDKYLRSVPGRQRARIAPVGGKQRILLSSLTLEYVLPEGGNIVHLTLDKTIQNSLEKEIDKALLSSQAPRGMGLVMDPTTGAILALACRPAYNPNVYSDTPPESYKDRSVIEVFEPGSAFKIVTASAALEHGLITPSTMIDCENGRFNPYGHPINDVHKLGVEPFSKCFEESSNIAMIKVAAMVGPERFEQWIRRYGFGSKTSSDFPAESAGILRARKNWSRLSMGSLPMGQELAVTMPQLACAYAVVANGGYLVEPYLVERTVDREGVVTYQHQPKTPQRILSASTAQTMKDLCHLVVMHGTGKPASIPEYRVGGKTGTAQIAREGVKGFVPNKYTAIFAGFAPVANPRLCAVIVIQEPAIKLHFGGTVSGPVFKEVVRDALIRLNVPKDPVDETVETPEDVSDDDDTVIARTDAELGDVPDAPVLSAQEQLDTLELVQHRMAISKDEGALPNLFGMTKRQAKECLDSLGVVWDPQGAGRVVAQDPSPGTLIEDVQLCKLVFANEPVAPDGATQPALVTPEMLVSASELTAPPVPVVTSVLPVEKSPNENPLPPATVKTVSKTTKPTTGLDGTSPGKSATKAVAKPVSTTKAPTLPKETKPVLDGSKSVSKNAAPAVSTMPSATKSTPRG